MLDKDNSSLIGPDINLRYSLLIYETYYIARGNLVAILLALIVYNKEEE